MEQIRYRLLNRKDRSEVGAVVLHHERSPLEWDASHVVEDVRIERSIETLSGPALANGRESWVMVALAASGELVGSHWLYVEGELEYRAVTIVSLYVDPRFRRTGVARKLKEAGEEWARASGAREIRTTVSLVNEKMIALNEGLGFQRNMLLMKKRLADH